MNTELLIVRQLAAALTLVACGHVYGQDTVKVLRPVWESLSAAERASIQKRHVVDVRESSAFGLVIDNQGVDVSTPGTTGGAALGSAVANATYVDRAFSPSNNYSAKTHLAATILGAVIGSSLDKPGVQQYHFRYALKLHDGEISYRESVQGGPFRHPVGMCLELLTLSPVPQVLCTQTVADVRKTYLMSPADSAAPTVTPVAPLETARVPQEPAVAPPVGDKIDCKLGNLAPVSTTPDKCNAIGGKTL